MLVSNHDFYIWINNDMNILIKYIYMVRFFLQNDIDDYLSEEIIEFEINNFKTTVKETQGNYALYF
jgi:hypothetical protein